MPTLKKDLGISVKDLSYDSYMWALENGGIYKAVSMFIYSRPQALDYDGAISGAATSAKAKAISQKQITRNGIEGREAIFDAPDNIRMRMRLFIVKGRFYQILVVTQSGDVSTAAI